MQSVKCDELIFLYDQADRSPGEVSRYTSSSDWASKTDRLLTAHQIRVHLQYLGYPIVNDPLYGDPRVWGPTIGKGGVDLTPDADEDHKPTDDARADQDEATLSSQQARMRGEESLPSGKIIPKAGKTEQDLARLKKRLKGELLPLEAEVEDDAVGGSPIYLSREAREVIAKLRRQKDEAEDWVKWVAIAVIAFEGEGR